MPGLFQMARHVHTVPRIAQATQSDRLQNGIVFNQKDAHGGLGGYKRGTATTQVRFRSGLTSDKHGMSIRHLSAGRTALRFLSQVLGLGWVLSAAALAQPLSLQQSLDAAAANWEVALSKRNLQAAQADVVAANRAPLPVFSA